jgi:protein-L-isoaspartate(D-aspartate) O-methyltransferase
MTMERVVGVTTRLEAGRQRMLELLRRRMVSERVIQAMASVPREAFVAPEMVERAYDDSALPIGEGQTISQPLVVAIMVDALALKPDDRVLEVGSGSGYAAAVLSRLSRDVIGIERIDGLRVRAEEAIARLGWSNVRFHAAGATLGRIDEAPYDAILVSAGAPHVPRALLDQLSEGGRMIIPVGDARGQELVRARKTECGVSLARMGACAFVPLLGEDAWPVRDAGVSGGVGRSNVR